jgi:hypothetical protein
VRRSSSLPFFPASLLSKKSQSQFPAWLLLCHFTTDITTTKYVLHSLCVSIGSEAHSFPASRAPCYLFLDILATLTDFKPSESLLNFQCRSGFRDYSSYVFLWSSLSQYHFSVFLSSTILLGFCCRVAYTQAPLNFLFSWASFLSRVFQLLNVDIPLPLLPSNNVSTRGGMSNIRLSWRRCIWVALVFHETYLHRPPTFPV